MDTNLTHLSHGDRDRILRAGALVAKAGYDRLYRYFLPNGKVFAVEEIDDDRVVLGPTQNVLFPKKYRFRLAFA